MDRKNGMNATMPPSNARARLRIHPLFLLLGVYYSFTGELVSFVLSTVVALQHECAHAFAAAKRGYCLNRVVLMPYGAVIDGDLSGISFRDELYVAVSGPLCNFLTAAGFIALWWLFPSVYPYTDAAAIASLSVALVNLLPAYPLDGGRILCAALGAKIGERRARKVCKRITLTVALAFAGLLIAFVCKKRFSVALLVFTLFLFVGGLGNGKDGQAAYEKIRYFRLPDLARGMEIKRVAVLKNCTFRRAVSLIEQGRYLVLDVYDENEEKIAEIPQNRLAEYFERGNLNDKVVDYL